MPAPLPDDLVRRPRRTGQLLAAGVTAHDLRGSLWATPLRGVRAWAASGEGPDQRIAAAAALLPPGGAVGGWAAARRLGVPTLDGERTDGTMLPVLLLVPAATRLRPRAGVVLRRTCLDDGEVVEVDGIPVSSGPRTAFDLAREEPVPEAVAGIDALLHAEVVSYVQLRDYAGRHRRWRGVRQVRRAANLCDARAKSLQESRLRMIWVLGGLPRPLVNAEVFDPEGGFLGRVDLLDEEAGVAVEYDGAPHAAAERRAADHGRQADLERAGLLVVRFAAPDLREHRQPATLARMREARERGLRRDRRGDRWQLSALPFWLAWTVDERPA